jgi:hypothetical protein
MMRESFLASANVATGTLAGTGFFKASMLIF